MRDGVHLLSLEKSIMTGSRHAFFLKSTGFGMIEREFVEIQTMYRSERMFDVLGQIYASSAS